VWTPVDDGETVNCAKICSIVATQLVGLNVGDNGTGTSYSVCFFVDGNMVNPCFNSGTSTINDNFNTFTVSNMAFVTGLPVGSHTVQTQVFVNQNGASLLGYNLRYERLP
jgi:hypothetical protein